MAFSSKLAFFASFILSRLDNSFRYATCSSSLDRLGTGNTYPQYLHSLVEAATNPPHSLHSFTGGAPSYFFFFLSEHFLSDSQKPCVWILFPKSKILKWCFFPGITR